MYVCQDYTWMDSEVMFLWVEQVSKPYSQAASSYVKSILYMDSYCCHMPRDMVTEVQKLGIETQHIPGGCTSCCQSVDVGFNKPFMNCIQHKWHEWIFVEAEENNVIKAPTHAVIAQWIASTNASISEEIICNSWMHVSFNWFKVEK